MRNLKKQIKEGAEKVSEALYNLRTYFRFLKFSKIAMRITLILLLMFANIPGTNSKNETSGGASAMVEVLAPEVIYVNSVRDQFHERLVTEVDNYITKIAPAARLDPDNLVRKCLEYNTDIIFVLSQALLESHFGTKGKAAETNSVWNVGTYDDGQILYRYRHPDESLEPYLKLVNDKYLIEVTSQGDTIFKDLHHLVQDRGYTNYDGRRFASARGYENGMRKLMVRIDMETSIAFYQEILTLHAEEILAYFVPAETLSIDSSKLQAMK